MPNVHHDAPCGNRTVIDDCTSGSKKGGTGKLTESEGRNEGAVTMGGSAFCVCRVLTDPHAREVRLLPQNARVEDGLLSIPRCFPFVAISQYTEFSVWRLREYYAIILRRCLRNSSISVSVGITYNLSSTAEVCRHTPQEQIESTFWRI